MKSPGEFLGVGLVVPGVLFKDIENGFGNHGTDGLYDGGGSRVLENTIHGGGDGLLHFVLVRGSVHLGDVVQMVLAAGDGVQELVFGQPPVVGPFLDGVVSAYGYDERAGFVPALDHAPPPRVGVRFDESLVRPVLGRFA